MKETKFFDREMTYREALIDAGLILKYFMESLEDRIFQIALTKELKPWIDSVPIDENHEIEMEVLEACNDENIIGFVKLLQDIKGKNFGYLTMNKINDDEMKKYEKDKFDAYWNDDDSSDESLNEDLEKGENEK